MKPSTKDNVHSIQCNQQARPMSIYPNKLTIYLSIISIFAGCSRNSEPIRHTPIPAPILLAHESRTVGTDLLLPTKIFLHKDKLIIFEQVKNDMFKVFDPQTFEHLYSFGNIGRANNEISVRPNNDAVIVSDRQVEIYDVGKLKTIEFGDSSASIIKTIPIPFQKDDYPINRLKKINDSLYYFDRMYREKDRSEFVKLNIATRDRHYFGYYPNWCTNRLSDTDKYRLYLKSAQYNEKQDKIAAFYYLYPVLKIIDASTGICSAEIHIDGLSDFSFRNADKEKILFTEPFVTDDRIYVMWANIVKNEVGKKGTDFTPSIFVFDWKGNLTANYQLDKPVIAFTVSEELGKIYCTSLEEGNIIYEYNLPPLDNSNFAPQTTEHVETAYYTIELPETYATTSKQPDAITLFKGYYGNVNYFAPQRTQEGLTEGRFSGTVCIGLFEPSEKADPNATPFDHEDGTIGKSTFFVNDIETERLIQTTTVEENGNIQAIYHATYRFSIENTRIRLTVTHMRNDFEEPEQKQMIRHILESFRLKQHLNH